MLGQGQSSDYKHMNIWQINGHYTAGTFQISCRLLMRYHKSNVVGGLLHGITEKEVQRMKT